MTAALTTGLILLIVLPFVLSVRTTKRFYDDILQGRGLAQYWREFANVSSQELEIPSNRPFTEFQIWLDDQLLSFPSKFYTLHRDDFVSYLHACGWSQLPNEEQILAISTLQNWQKGLDERPLWRKWRCPWAITDDALLRVINFERLQNWERINSFDEGALRDFFKEKSRFFFSLMYCAIHSEAAGPPVAGGFLGTLFRNKAERQLQKNFEMLETKWVQALLKNDVTLP